MFGNLNEEQVAQYDPKFISKPTADLRVEIIAVITGSVKKGFNLGDPYTIVTFEAKEGSRFTVYYDHQTEHENADGDKFGGGRSRMRQLALACGHYGVKEGGERCLLLDEDSNFDPIVLKGKSLIVDVIPKKKKDGTWDHKIRNESEIKNVDLVNKEDRSFDMPIRG
jgi:hypothetical protein